LNGAGSQNLAPVSTPATARLRGAVDTPGTLTSVEIRVEVQRNPVADEVAALFAVVRPILDGLLYALKHDVVAEAGGSRT
jgi:hypothetical protein